MTNLPTSPLAGICAIELDAMSEPLLQRFFEANPAYFLAVQGEPARPGAAREEIHEPLPAGWSFTRKWLIGYVDTASSLIAIANVVSDLLATGVWHVGTFIVATERHGKGEAQVLFASVERWARDNGAQWLRLGVVAGNARAQRFWHSQGFTQVRTREGMQFGSLTQTVLVMYKPLAGGTPAEYLSLVPRDQPDRHND
ncbi:MAG: GNAT family N-acetyltransferase [Burkholderiales bacterium]|nr:GNAT family N-acetyltransferase [Burkholderiales bacterium]